MNWLSDILPTLLGALVAVGLFDWVRTSIRSVNARLKSGTESEQRLARLTETDKSILVLAKTRDELIEDIGRLREQLHSCEERLETERQLRERERVAYQAEIGRLQDELRSVRSKVDGLLEEVDRMRSVHQPTEGNA